MAATSAPSAPSSRVGRQQGRLWDEWAMASEGESNDATGTGKAAERRAAAPSRAERLSAALRENLHKRKEQARVRKAGGNSKGGREPEA